uniref:(northern house mosquito) hypothetical protein n=1 Tax=Culex pipiens TaxID=7175 RepID=A0A8D8FC80_CULPI
MAPLMYALSVARASTSQNSSKRSVFHVLQTTAQKRAQRKAKKSVRTHVPMYRRDSSTVILMHSASSCQSRLISNVNANLDSMELACSVQTFVKDSVKIQDSA